MTTPKSSRPNALDSSGRSELALAAAVLDAELRRYEELATAAQKIKLTSEKNIERAARAIDDAAVVQQRIAQHVQSLVAAVQSASEKQLATAAGLHDRAEEVRARTEIFGALMRKFAVLGESAKVVNSILQLAAQKKREAKAGEADAEFAGHIKEVNDQLGVLAAAALELVKEAAEHEMEDIQRQADALRQQLVAARNKLSLLVQTLGGAAS